MKKIYAVADFVPEGCGYITEGKEYEVISEHDDSFVSVDDAGGEFSCYWERALQLHYHDWRRVERES